MRKDFPTERDLAFLGDPKDRAAVLRELKRLVKSGQARVYTTPDQQTWNIWFDLPRMRVELPTWAVKFAQGRAA